MIIHCKWHSFFIDVHLSCGRFAWVTCSSKKQLKKSRSWKVRNEIGNEVRKVEPKLDRSTEVGKWPLRLENFEWSWKGPFELENLIEVRKIDFDKLFFFFNHPFQLHVSQIPGIQCKLYITENVKHQLIVIIDGSVKSQYLVCSIRTWNCILRQHLHFTRIRSPKYTCHRTVRFVPIQSTIFMLHTLEKWFIIDVYLLKLLFRIIISS